MLSLSGQLVWQKIVSDDGCWAHSQQPAYASMKFVIGSRPYFWLKPKSNLLQYHVKPFFKKWSLHCLWELLPFIFLVKHGVTRSRDLFPSDMFQSVTDGGVKIYDRMVIFGEAGRGDILGYCHSISLFVWLLLLSPFNFLITPGTVKAIFCSIVCS